MRRYKKGCLKSVMQFDIINLKRDIHYMGPMLIIDKSALQSFSLDESVWLENFFLTNITSLFFVKSLADLDKEVSEGKTPEDAVGALASKTSVNGSFSNVHHALVFESDLMGFPIEMDMRAIIHRGTTKQTPYGEISVFYKQSPEEAAFQRWKDRQFQEVEREVAKKWREALSNFSFDSMIGTVKNIVPVGTHFSNMKGLSFTGWRNREQLRPNLKKIRKLQRFYKSQPI